MKIKTILSQHRRDFEAIYECEHCGYAVQSGGYDDYNYHNVVIPCTICPECGKTAPDDYIPMDTKYEAWEVV